MRVEVEQRLKRLMGASNELYDLEKGSPVSKAILVIK